MRKTSFNYFEELGAFKFENKVYKVDFAKMKSAVDNWAEKILIFQGNGDYDGAVKFLAKYGVVKPELQTCLDHLKTAKIPVDIVFEQGAGVLGLK